MKEQGNTIADLILKLGKAIKNRTDELAEEVNKALSTHPHSRKDLSEEIELYINLLAICEKVNKKVKSNEQ